MATETASDIDLMIEDSILALEPPSLEVKFRKGHIEIGDVLDGKYRIDRLIGQGGMGAVYEAFETTLQRRVAIKVIQSAYSSIPNFRERFRREAVAMAAVDHTNIVRIHHCEVRDTGPSYIVMEYVEGETLGDMIEREGRLPYDLSLEVCQQVLRALYAIHRGGIIHRDLKPRNIMLTKSSRGYRVRICDFGLGKALERTDPGHARTELTEIGVLLGTPNYMSPEQCRGERVLETSDIYSVGIVLFEMLTGRPPFEGGTKHSTMMRHLATPPPLDRLPRDIPKGIRNVLSKALAKNRDSRYVSAIMMIRGLNGVRKEKSKGTSSRRLLPILLLLVLTVSLGAVAFMGFHAVQDSEASGVTKTPKRVAVNAPKKVAKATVKPQLTAQAHITEIRDEPKPEVEESSPKVLTEWSRNPSALLQLAQSYGDSGDLEMSTEALRRFLAVCENKRNGACSPANRGFARVRLRGQ